MKNTNALNFSTQCTLFFITLITILAELIPSLKNAITQITFHHWVSKGLLAVIFFFLCYFLKKGTSKESISENKNYSLITATCVYSVILFGYFGIHHLMN